MVQTYVEKFNYYLSVFLLEIKNIYPEFQDSLQKNFGELLKDEAVSDNSNDLYVKQYMTVIKPHLSSVAGKNEKIFKGLEPIYLLPDIDFRDVWSKDINQNTRENIWKYLQTLVVIGKKIVGDDEEIDVLLNQFNSQKESSENENENESQLPDGMDEEMLNMLKNMSTMTQDPDDIPETSEGEMKNLFEGGIISDIAQELTQELDLENLDMGNPKNMNEAFSNLMGGGGKNNFFNLVTKVGEKIQNKVQKGEVNQGDLMKEAQKMMGGLKNPEKMANIMKAKHQQTGGSTRDRLRKKLQERKANQSA